jgi:gamma-glutamylcyclotransferase
MNYFAYGSNLSTSRLLARIPTAIPKTVATVSGYTLRFHKIGHDKSGKCDIVPTRDRNANVHGIIYDISRSDKAVLDEIEGVGNGYKIANLRVTARNGLHIEVFTYLATSIASTMKPFDWYHHFVLAGAIEHSFPEQYLEAIRTTETIADPDRERDLRNRQILKQAKFE